MWDTYIITFSGIMSCLLTPSAYKTTRATRSGAQGHLHHLSGLSELTTLFLLLMHQGGQSCKLFSGGTARWAINIMLDTRALHSTIRGYRMVFTLSGATLAFPSNSLSTYIE